MDTIKPKYLILSGRSHDKDNECKFVEDSDNLEKALEMFDVLKKGDYDETYLYLYEAKLIKKI